jgi:hypothetical protein
LKFNLTYAVIAGIIGITLLLIWRMHTKEARESELTNYMLEGNAQDQLADDMEKLKMFNEIPPFDAYRDPELLEEYEKIPKMIYYYSPDRLSEKQSQLLLGTGTLPVYERQSPFKYPREYTAPVAVSQLPSDVPPPNRYDYLSWWDTQGV